MRGDDRGWNGMSGDEMLGMVPYVFVTLHIAILLSPFFCNYVFNIRVYIIHSKMMNLLFMNFIHITNCTVPYRICRLN